MTLSNWYQMPTVSSVTVGSCNPCHTSDHAGEFCEIEKEDKLVHNQPTGSFVSRVNLEKPGRNCGNRNNNIGTNNTSMNTFSGAKLIFINIAYLAALVKTTKSDKDKLARARASHTLQTTCSTSFRSGHHQHLERQLCTYPVCGRSTKCPLPLVLAINHSSRRLATFL